VFVGTIWGFSANVLLQRNNWRSRSRLSFYADLRRVYEWICIFSSDAFFPKIPPIHTHQSFCERSGKSPYLAKNVLNASAVVALVSIVDINGTFGRLVGIKNRIYICNIFYFYESIFYVFMCLGVACFCVLYLYRAFCGSYTFTYEDTSSPVNTRTTTCSFVAFRGSYANSLHDQPTTFSYVAFRG
jgi:hypothetical protein